METNLPKNDELANSIKGDVSSSYVVFQYQDDELTQLSVTLTTLDSARQFVKNWKSRTLYIYKLVE